MPVYAYRGNPNFIDAVEGRLSDHGYKREGEVELADIVVTFCTSMGKLEDLYFGDDGLVQVMKPGSTLVDLSAATPNFAREMNAIATVSDLHMIEAPISVSDMTKRDAFESDNLTCYVAGEEDTVEANREFLEAICSKVQFIGGAGTAQLVRATNTLQIVAEIVSSIEAQSLLNAARGSVSGIVTSGLHTEAASFEAQAILDAINKGQFNGDFTSEMLMSELSAAIMAADDYELILPHAEASMHLLELLAVVGGADKSPASLSLVYSDEKTCADNGLDWSRAESVYGNMDENEDYEDDYDPFEDGLDDMDDQDSMGFGYSIN